MMKSPLRFDRNEVSGAFGDIGTDLPLITGMILASGLDSASVLVVFGVAQMFSALVYRMPMAVQPLKAVAALVIAERLSGNLIFGAGLAIGLTMLFLTFTGLIDWLGRVLPKAVIRGIQFGLGAKLSLLALQNYVQADGSSGFLLAGISFVIIIFLMGNRRYPPALFLIILGILYALIFRIDLQVIPQSLGFSFPTFFVPQLDDIWQGFLLLALPQVPLSLGNSIYATNQIANDLFPEKKVTVKKIGLTYSLMNLIVPFFSGIPVCHGSGGLAGHYAFGGRTGGSVFIYGGMFLIIGLFFSNGFSELIHFFPLPVLGVILFFEGLTLMRFIGDTVGSKSDFSIALIVGLIAAGLPYGFLVGIVLGTIMYYINQRFRLGIGK
ncbi:MAG: transporter [Calditrichaeota bacterium]|nr:MAG: transporter [Calditrichota bacterium]